MLNKNINALTALDILSLEIQRVVSRLLFVLIGPIMSYMVFKKYKITASNLYEIRQKYRSLVKNGMGPVLICSNHLTYADSIIQSVFLSSPFGHFVRFNHLAWHLPEKSNFEHNFMWKIICYLGKCIPVVRSGSPQQSKHSLSKMKYVLGKGDVISVFPEGTRSRNGLVDDINFSYATGQILKDYESANVLCIYMRDKKNGSFAKFPQKNAEYYFEMSLIKINSEYKGMRRVKDISSIVIRQLKLMEENFQND